MTAISDSRTLQTPSLTILHPLREFFTRADSLKDLNKLNSLEYIVLYPTVGVSPLGGLKTPAPTKFTFHLKGGRTTFKSFYFSCFFALLLVFQLPFIFLFAKSPRRNYHYFEDVSRVHILMMMFPFFCCCPWQETLHCLRFCLQVCLFSLKQNFLASFAPWVSGSHSSNCVKIQENFWVYSEVKWWKVIQVQHNLIFFARKERCKNKKQ